MLIELMSLETILAGRFAEPDELGSDQDKVRKTVSESIVLL